MLSRREVDELQEKLRQVGVRESSIPDIINSIHENIKEPVELHKTHKKMESSLKVNEEFGRRLPLVSEGYQKGAVTHVPEHDAIRYWHTDGYGRVVQSILTREVLNEMTAKLNYFNSPDGII